MNLSTQKPIMPASLVSNTFSTKENYHAQALSLGVAGLVPFPAGTATIDGINLSFDGLGNTTVTGGPTSGTLNLGGIPATSIGPSAFYGCSGLTGSLTLPNSLTTIGSNAFYQCSGFTGSLVLGNSLVSCGTQAFGNNQFTRVYADVNASVIQSGSFYNCPISTIYYQEDKTGWETSFDGYPTAVWASYPDPMP